MLGFLLAAFIAAFVVGGIGLRHLQSLSQQSKFYQKLLQANAGLMRGANYLQLMDEEVHVLLDEASVPHPSKETLANAQNAVDGLDTHYEAMLHRYIASNLLDTLPQGSALLVGSDQNTQLVQQRTRVTSILRTWQTYHQAQIAIMHFVALGDIHAAQDIERLQGEPTNSDALSALQELIRFDQDLANTVRDAAYNEQQRQLMMTIWAALITFAGIVCIGWLISSALALRLKHLRKVTQAAEAGQLDARLKVVGHDELADVSSSINAMMETMLADKQVALAYEQQRNLNALKDQFIVNVSHELRTPLTQIYGYLELLSEFQGKLDTETMTTFVRNAKDGCQELMLLVNTVLDATRVSSDVNPPELTVVSVAQEVQEVLKQFGPHYREAYAIHVDISEGCTVWADLHYLRQVLRNLLSNAFKYSPELTSIMISARPEDAAENESEDQVNAPHCICISVKDAGPGIPPEELHLLFQKFVRLKRDLLGTVRGTGLGLYISKRMVEAMNGRIWAESSGIAGEGSRFCFTLPVATVLSASAQIQEQEPSECV